MTSSALRNGEKVTELSSIKKTLESEAAELKLSLEMHKEQSREELARAEVHNDKKTTDWSMIN